MAGLLLGVFKSTLFSTAFNGGLGARASESASNPLAEWGHKLVARMLLPPSPFAFFSLFTGKAVKPVVAVRTFMRALIETNA